MLVLVWAVFFKYENFLMVVLIVKPFIDMTVNAKIVAGLSALELSGVLIFLVLLIKFLRSGYKKSNFNIIPIILFLIVHILTFLIAVLVGDLSAKNAIEWIVKFVTGYLFYFVAVFTLLKSAELRKKTYFTVWVTLTIAGLLTSIIYLTGISNFDITRGLMRYNGLYNDPGNTFLSRYN